MNDLIKTSFTIKDLEHLSGIKAHTIRIWEKRHQILKPMRTESNIRYYDSASLQRLLNVQLLNASGFRLSAIKKFDDSKVSSLVSQLASDKNAASNTIAILKVAMVNFDQRLFNLTFNFLMEERSFRQIFKEAIVPLMEEIGLLWQSNAISPAHEHFITYLIRQKIFVLTERLQMIEPRRKEKVFVLFLPQNELHDIGLLYANYEILSHGYQTIYLGENIPVESLTHFKNAFENITFVSYFTVAPQHDEMLEYLVEFEKHILGSNDEFWLLGTRTFGLENVHPRKFRLLSEVNMLLKQL